MQRALLLMASALFSSPAWAAPANYTAVISDKACVNTKSCTLSFPPVPSGKTVTINHVSCGVVTSGESGFLDNAVLSTMANGALGDHLNFTDTVSGSNGGATISQSTLYYVNAGDAATITLTSGAAIQGSSDGGCLISGTIK